MPDNVLYYGDNLDVLRRYVPDESVDLVYLDSISAPCRPSRMATDSSERDSRGVTLPLRRPITAIR